MKDRVIETPYGFEIEVAGRRHGTWRSRAEARGALTVQTLREADRQRREAARPMFVPVVLPEEDAP
jgi:hypothetical protein